MPCTSAKHKDYEEVINGSARKTVEAMSYTFPRWPYPYAHETVFDGLDQMEYPMMVNDNPTDTRDDAITLTDHEIFHTMFPFYMGINETKYGWMDEGWATIGEWVLSSIIEPKLDDDYGIARYAQYAAPKTTCPSPRSAPSKPACPSSSTPTQARHGLPLPSRTCSAMSYLRRPCTPTSPTGTASTLCPTTSSTA